MAGGLLTADKELAVAMKIEPGTVKAMLTEMFGMVEEMGFKRPGNRAGLLNLMFE